MVWSGLVWCGGHDTIWHVPVRFGNLWCCMVRYGVFSYGAMAQYAVVWWVKRGKVLTDRLAHIHLGLSYVSYFFFLFLHGTTSLVPLKSSPLSSRRNCDIIEYLAVRVFARVQPEIVYICSLCLRGIDYFQHGDVCGILPSVSRCRCGGYHHHPIIMPCISSFSNGPPHAACLTPRALRSFPLSLLVASRSLKSPRTFYCPLRH